MLYEGKGKGQKQRALNWPKYSIFTDGIHQETPLNTGIKIERHTIGTIGEGDG
jgi:hypothetical protein